jgi:phospholipid/cholesterol/gamma-HCH transport system substrate-binding protein
MDSKVNYALIGFFVILLSLILVVTILWLSVGTERKIYNTYVVYIKESVAGLNENAPVKYQGVDVGTVQDISFVPQRPGEVRLFLKIEQGTPLRKDASATLASQGLTGLAYIELDGGKAKEPLPDEAPYPEIESKPSLFVRLDTAVSKLVENADGLAKVADNLLEGLKELAEEAQVLVSKENQQAVADTLHNVQRITTNVAAQSDQLDAIFVSTRVTLKNSERISAALPDLLAQLQTSLAAFARTADSITRTSDSVNTVVAQSQKDIKATTTAVADAATSLNTDISRITREMVPQISALLTDLKLLTRSFNEFSQSLQRQPDMLIFGREQPPPGPGEK